MLSSTQLLELFVVLCTAGSIRYGLSKARSAFVHSHAKSGPVRPDSMPTRLSHLITPLQVLVNFFVPTIYVLSTVAAGFNQPQWMHALALPDVVFDAQLEGLLKNAARVFAGVVSIALLGLSDDTLRHLGDQFHIIGRREKSRIIQTGPYAWVRHPFYSLLLLHPVLWVVMFWSYAPLFAVVATAVVFAVKIPIEEGAILRDDAVKEEYRLYMRKVPARLVPGVW